MMPQTCDLYVAREASIDCSSSIMNTAKGKWQKPFMQIVNKMANC